MTTLRNNLTRALLVLTGSALFAIAEPASNVPNYGPTLSIPASAEMAPDAAGFLPRWLILEPIPVRGQLTDNAIRSTVGTNYFADQLTVVPHDGDKVTAGNEQLTWHALDTKEYNLNLYHFAYAIHKPTSNVLFWGVTTVNCPEEMTNVRLAIGCNASSIWWVNGQEVIGIYGDRQTVIDDGVSKRLTLKKGQNIIRCAVVNGGGATDFCARFFDSEDKPIKNITLSVGAIAK